MKRLIIILVFILINITNAFSLWNHKDTLTFFPAHYSLKVDVFRTLFEQPQLSFEYCFKKNFSFELGATYFKTGGRSYGYSSIFGDVVNSMDIGPCEGYNFYGDVKLKLRGGHKNTGRFYVGIGGFYRYENCNNVICVYEPKPVNQGGDVYMKMSEESFTTGGRITAGIFIRPKKWKRLYINPYIALESGISRVNAKIDTMWVASLHSFLSNFTYPTFPYYVNKTGSSFFVEIGFKIGFGWKQPYRKQE